MYCIEPIPTKLAMNLYWCIHGRLIMRDYEKISAHRVWSSWIRAVIRVVPCDIKCHGLGSVTGQGKGSADRLDVKVGKLVLITSHVTYQYGAASEEGENLYKCLLSTFNLYLSPLLATEPPLCSQLLIRRVRRIAKSGYYFRRVFLSVRPSVRGTTRFPLERFSWNFIFDYF
jgi:hypothetical protein